ncbi:hypothetical protein [Tenacibaculum piscium]|uniref:hypothetical protein n=1 Tax=Tenacibaculum piscium TaxID=1458515 RepID=UPI00187B49FD|nr:hypothetical protein [Tenacibaculum piscium]MBE7691147.1 hypothetical protein [Tenacibaculum piscium]
MIKEAEEILNGWTNYFIPNPIVEKLAIERAKKCGACKFKKKGLHAAVLPDITLGELQGYYCTACAKCPLSVKVRSENHKCPKNEW